MNKIFRSLTEKLQPKPKVVHNGVDGKKAMVKVGGVLFEGDLMDGNLEPKAIFPNAEPAEGVALKSQPIIKIPQ